ncbi:MAG: DNA polymerase IV, partial [Pseudomonadota bacterium]
MENSFHSISNAHPKVLCRDCTRISDMAPRCPHCHSPRLIAHEEVTSLSIAHVDCDAFFANIEKRDDPRLLDQPVIVGGGPRGVVATCCYIARSYGIRSAMPMFKALKLCPHAVVVRPHFEKYRKAASTLREEMQKLTPLVQPLSIDEAFLDLSGTHRLHGAAPASVLAKLALTIEAKVGITISVGLSHNKLLAKIASDLDKPRGFAMIGKAETLDFLAPKPPRFLFGVGARFDEKLRQDGYHTLGDLQKADLRRLVDLYGEHGFQLHALARGEDPRPVKTERETKSVSGETTFSNDIRDRAALE